jgi:hypothetical protein
MKADEKILKIGYSDDIVIYLNGNPYPSQSRRQRTARSGHGIQRWLGVRVCIVSYPIQIVVLAKTAPLWTVVLDVNNDISLRHCLDTL